MNELPAPKIISNCKELPRQKILVAWLFLSAVRSGALHFLSSRRDGQPRHNSGSNTNGAGNKFIPNSEANGAPTRYALGWGFCSNLTSVFGFIRLVENGPCGKVISPNVNKAKLATMPRSGERN
jgi:hypothetical protein